MVGDVLGGRYELEELVGAGGMSSVFRAHDRVLERTVALKVLHQRLSAEPEYVERFRREARMVAGLAHQNIVTVIDRDEQDGIPFIVFEFVPGENLKQFVQRSGPLGLEHALVLAIQVARGLAFAHANGFVHRDVKPQNVLLNDGQAKVTDFGIARSLDVKGGVTQTGTVLGSSDYIAPEQAQGRPVDEHTDVYSLGVVLYELLTGEVPFTGDNFVAVAMRHINEPAPSVRTLRPEVPPRVEAAIEKALAKDPADRFTTMADFGRELEASLEEVRSSEGNSPTMIIPPAPPRPASPPAAPASRPPSARARRRAPVALLLLLLLAVIAVAAVLGYLLLRDDNTNAGGGTGGGGGGGAPIALHGVSSWDPDGDDHVEHPELVADATDGNPSTFWETSSYHYPSGGLGKPGVGIVLEASRTPQELTVTTDTPGYTARIQSGDSPTGPFHDVSASQTVNATTTFQLRDQPGRYLVFWITNLGDHGQVHVNEVKAK